MSGMDDLLYDIEQLYIEGLCAKEIGAKLECSVDLVLAALKEFGVADSQQIQYDPFDTINS
jgi:hypothetical protein